MISTEPTLEDKMHLIWVFTDDLSTTMDAATWIEMARELKKMGWEITLITAGPAELEAIRGVPVLAVENPDVYLVRQFAFHSRVSQEIRQRIDTADVVLFHQMSAPWMFALRTRRRIQGGNRPLFVMDTRTAPMTPKEIATRRERVNALYSDTMNSLASRWADGQTAITLRMAEMMGIPDEKLLGVWPSGVALEVFAAAGNGRHWPTHDEAVRLIYIGSLHSPRNLMAMCSAVEKANAQGMHFLFNIVGDGSEREDLERVAGKTNGLITVLPPVPHEAIPALLADAHIGVLPFSDHESFRVSSPIKLFEYMASGLPILATDLECHTDVVGEGRYAFWASDPSVDALVRSLAEVWDNRDSLAHLGRLAQEASSDWTWAAAAEKLDRALREGLRQSGGTVLVSSVPVIAE